MLATPEVFQEHMRRLQVKRTDQIVCYDSHGIFSAPRVAWNLRYFGAPNVRVLNGGLKKWMLENRVIERGTPKEVPVDKEGYGYDYKSSAETEGMCISEIDEMHKLAYYVTSEVSHTQIIDARSAARFNSEVDEPRAGLRRGHVSGAKNLFFGDLVDPVSGCYKSEKEIAKLFHTKGLDTTTTTVAYCGSGVSACIVELALQLLGNDKVMVYDGSWSEYGQIPEPDFKHGTRSGSWNTPSK